MLSSQFLSLNVHFCKRWDFKDRSKELEDLQLNLMHGHRFLEHLQPRKADLLQRAEENEVGLELGMLDLQKDEIIHFLVLLQTETGV